MIQGLKRTNCFCAWRENTKERKKKGKKRDKEIKGEVSSQREKELARPLYFLETHCWKDRILTWPRRIQTKKRKWSHWDRKRFFPWKTHTHTCAHMHRQTRRNWHMHTRAHTTRKHSLVLLLCSLMGKLSLPWLYSTGSSVTQVLWWGCSFFHLEKWQKTLVFLPWACLQYLTIKSQKSRQRWRGEFSILCIS